MRRCRKTLAQPSVFSLIISVKAAQEKGADYNRNPGRHRPVRVQGMARAPDRLIAERYIPTYWDKDKPYLDRVIVRARCPIRTPVTPAWSKATCR